MVSNGMCGFDVCVCARVYACVCVCLCISGCVTVIKRLKFRDAATHPTYWAQDSPTTKHFSVKSVHSAEVEKH